MTFKSIFICDKCSVEGAPESKYAEWETLYNWVPSETRSGIDKKFDLCKECHEKVYHFISSKDI